MGRRAFYVLGILVLSGASLLFAVLIVVGELRDDYGLGGAALGAILIAYGLIVLLLRRLGIFGPRRAEGR